MTHANPEVAAYLKASAAHAARARWAKTPKEARSAHAKAMNKARWDKVKK